MAAPDDPHPEVTRSSPEDELLDAESHEVVVVLDEELRVVSVSDHGAARRRVFGLDVADYVGRSVLDVVHPDDQERVGRRARDVRDGRAESGTELRVGPTGGPYRSVYVRSHTRTEPDGHRFLDCLFRDIEDTKAIAAELAHLTLHDPLTDLPNHTLFVDRLEQAVAQRARSRSGLAVMVLNLDRFKYVIDGLGHRGADHVLVAVAERLWAATRQGDTLARLGGDEFAVVGAGFVNDQDAVGYGRRLRDAVRQPVALPDGREVSLDCSIGIAFVAPGDDAPRDLLREADAAKNLVKARGRGAVELSGGGLSQLARTHLHLEQELRHALAADELRVFYQPQVDRVANRAVGVEALVRWDHPRRGLVPPGEFIPLAEESDLIVEIGRFVLDTACRDTAAWRADGIDLRLSVNLAARHLTATGFCADVERVLRASGLEPDALTLEVTESTLFQDTEAVAATIECVRALGVHLALDDFGTGYSSLVYLRRFHVEVIKIDQSFVRGIGRDPEDELIIRGIIDLARSLGISLVAEGVETEAEADWLVAAGCTELQGFLYARPHPAEDLRRWLRTFEGSEAPTTDADPAARASGRPAPATG